jgi:hypothetical protein
MLHRHISLIHLFFLVALAAGKDLIELKNKELLTTSSMTTTTTDLATKKTHHASIRGGGGVSGGDTTLDGAKEDDSSNTVGIADLDLTEEDQYDQEQRNTQGGGGGGGSYCLSIRDCRSGYRCRDNRCFNPDLVVGGAGRCYDDYDCPNLFRCTADFRCVPYSGNTFCDYYNNPCPRGFYCHRSRCVRDYYD